MRVGRAGNSGNIPTRHGMQDHTTLCLGQEGGAGETAHADMYLDMNGGEVRVSHSDA
jgi:hypothetical protein